MPAKLSQRNISILQGAADSEILLEVRLALEFEYFPEPDPKPQTPKIFHLRILRVGVSELN